ncbi:hypothetical protein LAUMK7_02316 [Mycobacterium kansasii]|uniref:Uncharacterized protein n=1 Tax=Mycobacterium kansasii TaxID=1768 RepID=A0A653ESD1_MYCKA|nr:hypothetical protein MKANGN_08450 [Mycobacterium kansasii]VAZ59883.1 hypothetical protein LAUMK22_01685 [Mycobacterium kansasii]VAZ66205.1 hypothetical protein LAUMK40_02337 [Mycobacterium kansasii]VAZ74282.1 hypothetical protein LAUMK7_02316 [Mycobacterium kansasii]VTO99571.1 hypothetical protein BIN_B_02038 [Mycobacterium kansasii]
MSRNTVCHESLFQQVETAYASPVFVVEVIG